jgi:hypothetical protein
MFRFDSKKVLMATAIGGFLMASGPAYATGCMYSSRPHMVVPPNSTMINAALPKVPPKAKRPRATATLADGSTITVVGNADGSRTVTRRDANGKVISRVRRGTRKGGASASWTDANGKKHTATRKPGGPTVIDGKPVASNTPKGGASASWTNSDGSRGWARMDANGNTQFGPTGPMY